MKFHTMARLGGGGAHGSICSRGFVGRIWRLIPSENDRVLDDNIGCWVRGGDVAQPAAEPTFYAEPLLCAAAGVREHTERWYRNPRPKGCTRHSRSVEDPSRVIGF